MLERSRLRCWSGDVAGHAYSDDRPSGFDGQNRQDVKPGRRPENEPVLFLSPLCVGHFWGVPAVGLAVTRNE